jgi:hypothetical protein
MRSVRSRTASVFLSSPRQDRPWLPVLPHALAAGAMMPVLGGPACLAGLAVAALASFTVYLPLAALALNGGQGLPPDAPAPDMPPRDRAGLRGLGTAPAWLGALLAGLSPIPEKRESRSDRGSARESDTSSQKLVYRAQGWRGGARKTKELPGFRRKTGISRP